MRHRHRVQPSKSLSTISQHSSQFTSTTHHPRRRPPHQTPAPPHPTLRPKQPPPHTNQLGKTHILNPTLRQLPIPPILHPLNPLSISRRLNHHNRPNNLLLPNPLNHIPHPQIHHNRIPRTRHLIAQPLDFVERGLQPVLRLLATLRG
jgi:hypothetical protein